MRTTRMQLYFVLGSDAIIFYSPIDKRDSMCDSSVISDAPFIYPTIYPSARYLPLSIRRS